MAKAEDEWTSQQEGGQSEACGSGREETGEHEEEDLSEHHEEQTSEWGTTMWKFDCMAN